MCNCKTNVGNLQTFTTIVKTKIRPLSDIYLLVMKNLETVHQVVDYIPTMAV